jgi:large subunit ribosomal protein L25
MPAVVYGHGIDTTPVAAEDRVVGKVWKRAGKTHLVELSIDGGRPHSVLIRELQIDPRTARLLHADFFAVNLREKLTADVPLITIGEPPAVSQRLGLLLHLMTSIKVECLPGDLPAQLTVDVSGLEDVDSSVFVKDISVPEGVTLPHAEPDELVAKIAPLRVSAEAEAEAEEAAQAEEEAASEEEASGE